MTERKESPEARKKRLNDPMGPKGASFACAVLGLDDEYAPWFASQPRGAALRHFEQLNQLPIQDRERDLLERRGDDGRVAGMAK